jgi:hypothetical protein
LDFTLKTGFSDMPEHMQGTNDTAYLQVQSGKLFPMSSNKLAGVKF